jgi:hypothetical protein
MSSSPTNLIYGLVDPRTALIRYVGMSSSGMLRPRMHRYPSCPDTYCRRWVKSLQQEGLIYQIVVLETLKDGVTLPEAERWWIAYGRACGWPLTNLIGGGYISEAEIAELRRRREKRFEQKEAQARVYLSPKEIEDRVRSLRLTQAQRRPRNHTELRDLCFHLIEKHLGSDQLLIEVVIGARVTPDEAEHFYEDWLRMSKARSQRALQEDRLKTTQGKPG